MVIKSGEDGNQAQTYTEEQALLVENGRWAGVGDVGGTVDIGQCHTADQSEHQQKHPVEMLEQSSVKLKHNDIEKSPNAKKYASEKLEIAKLETSFSRLLTKTTTMQAFQKNPKQKACGLHKHRGKTPTGYCPSHS